MKKINHLCYQIPGTYLEIVTLALFNQTPGWHLALPCLPIFHSQHHSCLQSLSSSKYGPLSNCLKSAPATNEPFCKGISQLPPKQSPSLAHWKLWLLAFMRFIPVPLWSIWRWTSSHHSPAGTEEWLSEGWCWKWPGWMGHQGVLEISERGEVRVKFCHSLGTDQTCQQLNGLKCLNDKGFVFKTMKVRSTASPGPWSQHDSYFNRVTHWAPCIWSGIRIHIDVAS